MADFDPPSFSLGLDFGADPLDLLRVVDSEEEDELGAHPDPPKRVLKRLRRGHVAGMREEGVAASGYGGDDDIEEFSSQEDLVIDACPTRHFNSVCSSSKVPLHGSGVFAAPSSSHSKGKKMKEPTSDAPASSSLEAGHRGLMFPKLTLSPLRRFQLIDSDSDCDEPPKSEGVKSKDQAAVASSMANSFTSVEKTRITNMKQQSEDLWKDFHPLKSSCVATPVLDEVCDEYFKSLQNRSIAQKQGDDSRGTGSQGCQLKEMGKTGIGQTCNVGEHLAPAHLYFFNEDPRIRSLVRNRLPYFSPLPMDNSTGNQQPNESAIDYIAQFNGKASRPCGLKSSNGSKASTRGGRKPVKTATVQETSQGWVDPKSSSSKPTNVGKRRVHASGEAAAGHWYTNNEGRKVYVSKGGQELSGQGAYRCYRKESGGSRRSKKKTSSQRKKG